MKKILVLIAVSILFHGCTKTKEAKPIVQNDNAAEELHEENMAVPEIVSKYDDAFYESSDLIHCTYSWDKYKTRVIVLGNENFNPDLDTVNQDGENIKCIYFPLYDKEFKPAVYNSPYEIYDDLLEGHLIYNGIDDTLAIKQIYLKINPDDTIEVVAVARQFDGGSVVKIKNQDYQFCYKGKIYEASYTDLWK